ncbi:DUF5085 family protein [Macrococcoides canis]|uniref:DUF5085 family protein n=1 Tax=Macrococcoides canis TaxID=1855823 RepID=UPI0013E984BB|nr:DUF5085 family protein [Macrococcus canis]QIH76491.1 DUF5085 family protein [Macrococcus canis]
MPEIDMILLPDCAKIELELEKKTWLSDFSKINDFFIDREYYQTGPVVFTKEFLSLDADKYVAYVPLNKEIPNIPELNLEYIELLHVLPTVSTKCLNDDDFDAAYKEIRDFCRESDLIITNNNFYHVMLDYPGGVLFEIHAQVEAGDSFE